MGERSIGIMGKGGDGHVYQRDHRLQRSLSANLLYRLKNTGIASRVDDLKSDLTVLSNIWCVWDGQRA